MTVYTEEQHKAQYERAALLNAERGNPPLPKWEDLTTKQREGIRQVNNNYWNTMRLVREMAKQHGIELRELGH